MTAAPVASDSAQVVDDIVAQVHDHYGVASFTTNAYTLTEYVATSSTPRVNVRWTNCQHFGYTPKQVTGPDSWFSQVPIPAGAVPPKGTDGAMSIYDRDSGTLWELWKAQHTSAGWQACWGGRAVSATSGPGWFPDEGGASASGLTLSAGTVTMADVRSGKIDHVMALGVVDVRRYPARSWPAQRTDGGSTDPHSPAEGRRFRLSPSVDVDALHLSAVGEMIARAAQTYGFVVTDHSGAVSLYPESGLPALTSTGTDPWKALLAGTPSYDVLRGFPWQDLQALPTDYGKPS